MNDPDALTNPWLAVEDRPRRRRRCTAVVLGCAAGVATGVLGTAAAHAEEPDPGPEPAPGSSAPVAPGGTDTQPDLGELVHVADPVRWPAPTSTDLTHDNGTFTSTITAEEPPPKPDPTPPDPKPDPTPDPTPEFGTQDTDRLAETLARTTERALSPGQNPADAFRSDEPTTSERAPVPEVPTRTAAVEPTRAADTDDDLRPTPLPGGQVGRKSDTESDLDSRPAAAGPGTAVDTPVTVADDIRSLAAGSDPPRPPADLAGEIAALSGIDTVAAATAPKPVVTEPEPAAPAGPGFPNPLAITDQFRRLVTGDCPPDASCGPRLDVKADDLLLSGFEAIATLPENHYFFGHGNSPRAAVIKTITRAPFEFGQLAIDNGVLSPSAMGVRMFENPHVNGAAEAVLAGVTNIGANRALQRWVDPAVQAIGRKAPGTVLEPLKHGQASLPLHKLTLMAYPVAIWLAEEAAAAANEQLGFEPAPTDPDNGKYYSKIAVDTATYAASVQAVAVLNDMLDGHAPTWASLTPGAAALASYALSELATTDAPHPTPFSRWVKANARKALEARDAVGSLAGDADPTAGNTVNLTRYAGNAAVLLGQAAVGDEAGGIESLARMGRALQTGLRVEPRNTADAVSSMVGNTVTGVSQSLVGLGHAWASPADWIRTDADAEWETPTQVDRMVERLDAAGSAFQRAGHAASTLPGHATADAEAATQWVACHRPRGMVWIGSPDLTLDCTRPSSALPSDVGRSTT